MEENIEVSLVRIREIISNFENDTFFTSDVLRAYSGGFYSNIGTPAVYSFNAQLGKLLKRNRQELNIDETETNVKIEDDNGHQTSTSKWTRN